MNAISWPQTATTPQERWLDFIIRQEIVGFFEDAVTLKSGQTSHWYVNWRITASDVYLLDQTSDHVLSFVDAHGLEVETFYGVPEGASKLAMLCQYKWALRSGRLARGSHTLAMGRGKPKTHGAPQDRDFIGFPKGPTLVLEDVTTTGGSLFETLQTLRQPGCEVIGALCLTDRSVQPTGHSLVAGKLAEAGLPMYAMSDAAQLLPRAAKAHEISSDIRQALQKEYPFLTAI